MTPPSDPTPPNDAGRDPEHHSFKEVVREEWTQIYERRRVPEDQRAAAPPDALVGLALSGGGIRSATFALGLLQGMKEHGALRIFDYMSTVSGGGFAGGWWSAWLSRKERKEEQEAGRPAIFPPDEERVLNGWDRAAAPASTGGPIHHLRLFANYLTPRKGVLSADSWRAGTIVTRNLTLTWLILLPLLLAAVLLGQLFFTLHAHEDAQFVYYPKVKTEQGPLPGSAGARLAPPAVQLADAQAIQAQAGLRKAEADARRHEKRVNAIGARALVAARPLALLFAWAVLLAFLWMLYGPAGGYGQPIVAGVGALAALGIAWTLYTAFRLPPAGTLLTQGWMVGMIAGAIVIVAAARLVPLGALVRGREERVLAMEILRNRVVGVHSTVLVALAVCAAVLLVAGFSHDLVWYLFDPASGGPVPAWAKQTGGWAAVLAAVGSMLFTGLAGSPTGGDGAASAEPGPKSKLVFAAAPVLAITLLAVLGSVAGRWMIHKLGQHNAELAAVDRALLIGVGLFLVFATFELLDGPDGEGGWKRALVPAAAVLGGIAVWLFAPDAVDLQLRHAVLWTAAAALLLLVRWGALSAGTGGAPSARGVVSGGLAGVAIVAFVTWLVFHAPARATPHIRLRRGEWDWYQLSAQATAYDRALLAALFACAVFAAAEYFLARSARPRALGLVTTAFLALALRVLLPYLPLDAFSIFHSSAAVTLATFALVWVVGLGWMADPNMVSLHTFYKARLVRAYMGASNPDRATRQITEAVHGDDILVKDLENCARGGPYHLVNTTLNLVGGRDLTTEQRSADHFVFSKLFCGSSRTGYRKTSAYMNGKLTLGTAVAASGAAASPNMGSKTPSAALSMLMAFLNVRLAFWAPTPSMNRWKEAQPRLWPFYLLRECLSQTNDLSPYCCLSDGGHFDNTGIYALAARGCRHIVVADCGADPTPCFEDIGTAIRRCRIDFGAEIELKIDRFPASGRAAQGHFAVGRITYTREHANALGWPPTADLVGDVIWIKPALTATAEPVDIRQYALQNKVFPQQTTGDQWYDEAQFESYRRLGEHTARQLFAEVTIPDEFTANAARGVFDQLRKNDPAAHGTFYFPVPVHGGEVQHA